MFFGRITDKKYSNNRMISLDIIRILAFGMVMYYHLICELAIAGIYALDRLNKLFYFQNVFVADLGVSLFFILSGVSLSLSKKDISPIQFYKNRFKKIVLPFYIVTIATYIINIALTHSLDIITSKNLPWWKWIFTVLGIDEMINAYGVKTFSLGIGEWFLGTIIIIYLLYPLLKKLIEKFEISFFIIMSIITVLFFVYITNRTFIVPLQINIIFKLYEFILGIYIGKHFLNIKKKIYLITLPLTIILPFVNISITGGWVIQTTLMAVLIFLTITNIAAIIPNKSTQTMNIIKNIIICFSGTTYEIFLVHHVIIRAISSNMAGHIRGIKQSFLMLILEIIVVLIAAAVLRLICDRINKKK